MTRLLAALTLLLFCSCAPSVPAQYKPLASPQASQAVRSDAQTVQNSPEAPKATQGPNLAATLQTGQLWATQTAEQYRRNTDAQTATQQVVSNGWTLATQKYQPTALKLTQNADATEVSLQVARFTQSANVIKATQAAPALLIEAADAEALAKSATWRALSLPIMQMGIGVGSLLIALCLVLYVFASWRRQQTGPIAEQEPDPFQELNKLGRPIIPVEAQTLDTDTLPPGDVAQFARLLDYANAGGALGIGSVMDSKIYTNHLTYVPVLEWLRKKNALREKRVPPLPSLFQTEKSGKLSFSPAGKHWAFDWLYKHPLPPAPPQDIPQNSADTGHARDDNDVMDSGEVDQPAPSGENG